MFSLPLPLPEKPVSLLPGEQVCWPGQQTLAGGRDGNGVGSSGLISGSKKMHLYVSIPDLPER